MSRSGQSITNKLRAQTAFGTRKTICLYNVSYLSFLYERWAKFSEPHICCLIDALRETCIIKEIIDSGVFIKLRRRLTKLVMISRDHPYTEMLFKSRTEIRHEEVKHLVNHKHMIHPFSIFCLYYEFIMTISTIFYLIYILPTDLHYQIYYRSIKWTKFAFDMQMTLSIFITFYIGYVDKENMCIYMKQKIVARCYLKKYFIWDLLSCVPSYLIFLYVLPIPSKRWTLMKWLSLLRLVRIPAIEHALDMFILYYKVPAEIFIALQIILRSQVVILCCMTLIAGLSTFKIRFQDITEEFDKEMAKELIFDTLKSVIGVGKLVISYTYLEAISRIFITAVSLILNFWITAKLYILWQRYLVLTEVGEDHYQQLAGYLKYKGLPPHIRKDIYGFYEFKFQTKFCDESAIISMLTDNLQKEIPKFRIDPAIVKIRFIRLLSNSMTSKLVSNMEAMYYCPGDVIFRIDGASTNLYFIHVGTVALHNELGMEVCHLEDGAYYGDLAVVLKLIHLTTMTAITPCKIFLLKHHILMQILAKEPEIKENVLEFSRLLLLSRKNDWVVVKPPRTQRSVTVIARSQNPSKENLSPTPSKSKSDNLRLLRQSTGSWL